MKQMRTRPDRSSRRPCRRAANAKKSGFARENQELRRQLAELKRRAHMARTAGLPRSFGIRPPSPSGRSSSRVIALVVVAFFAGYIPLQKRRAVIAGEAHEQERRSAARGGDRGGRARPARAELAAARQHPGHHRGADSGARRRLHPAPHGGHRRSRPGRPAGGRNRSAGTGRAGSPGEGAICSRRRPRWTRRSANYQQGKTDTELARVTAERWANLVAKGVVSRQENDQYQAQYQSQVASVQALEKAMRRAAQQRRRRGSEPGAPRENAELPGGEGAVRRRDHAAQCGCRARW